MAASGGGVWFFAAPASDRVEMPLRSLRTGSPTFAATSWTTDWLPAIAAIVVELVPSVEAIPPPPLGVSGVPRYTVASALMTFPPMRETRNPLVAPITIASKRSHDREAVEL